MASEDSSQKRKRGRPPNASKLAAPTNALQNGTAVAPIEYDADAEEESRPRKRGRPRKSIDSPVAEAVKPRKKGRPPVRQTATEDNVQEESRDNQVEEESHATRRKGRRNQQNKEAGEQDSDKKTANAPPRKTRGRPSLTSAEDAQEEARKVTKDMQLEPRRKRGRPSLQATREAVEPPQDDEQEAEPTHGRKRGRPSLQPTTQHEEQQPSRKKARRRASLQDLSPSGAQNSNAKAKKKTKASQPDTQKSPAGRAKQLGTSKGDKNKRGRPSQPQQSPSQPSRTSAGAETTHPEGAKAERRRHRSSQGADPDAAPPPSPPKPYLHVAPRVHRVRQSVIENRWSPLSGAALAAATTILQLAHRPILERLAGTQQRRTHAFAALRLVASRIARKMHKGLPFPPATMAAPRRGRRKVRSGPADDDDDDGGGREAELDFEKVLDARQALERQLDPALHAVDLLRREKDRVQRELERDYQALKALETGARSQAREQRGQLKKAHILAPEGLASQQGGDEGESLELKREDDTLTGSGSLFKDLDKDILQPLALQLSGHMDSIQTNLQQAKGIVPQIAESRAMLQDVLLRHLEPEQYEQVVLG